MDKNRGWSFCIVTAPGNEEILKQCINKIHDEFKDVEKYEIIIIGNPNFKNEIVKKIKIVPFNEEIFSIKLSNLKRAVKEFSIKRLFYRTGAICQKKNLAAKNAQYDKLCIMHDYVGIERGWEEGFERFGDSWDVCMNIILNQDNTRHRDWMAWDHPLVSSNPNGEGACLIPYDKYTKFMYISGTYFCIKRDFFLENPLNEKLFWGEGEDVEWSFRVREKTQFKMNDKSVVKYLKLKNINDPPYSESWKVNQKVIEEFFREK